MGADIVDVNMGCPVPKIAKHDAGCSLMRQPSHAAAVIAAMAKAVRIPVTVKMRAGWDDDHRNAPALARMVEDAGAAAVAVHGRTAAQSYSGSADWDLVAEIADALAIPVFGSGDCVEAAQVIGRLRSGVEGVLVGRGVLRNPWILAQALDIAEGRAPREVTMAHRGQFLLDYIELLKQERVREPEGFRHSVESPSPRAKSHDRWIVNKLRALGSWYTKGLDNGSHLRTAVNSADSLAALDDIIVEFFMSGRVCCSEHPPAAITL
jgi:tRNA-dihydrouridine synthase B